MKPLLFVALLALTGCSSALPYNRTSHTIEKWEAVPNARGGISRVLVFRERWKDSSGFPICDVFTDPNVSGFVYSRTNQTALGGSSRVGFGSASSKVDADAIKATGTAAGNVIGGVVKSSAGIP